MSCLLYQFAACCGNGLFVRDLKSGLFEFCAEFIEFQGLLVAGFGGDFPLSVEFGKLTFVVAFDDGDTAGDVSREVGDDDIVLTGLRGLGSG